ncbi:hypothetical protein [Dyella subtropica]|uniref:hypothetical protein n=1 Tax=Dyella subtropica TaxID=2992127 RepID=UPI0022534401|nr:hypothetical protein [Dyella subtropica]
MSRLLSAASSRRGLLVVSFGLFVVAAGAAYAFMRPPSSAGLASAPGNAPAVAATSGGADDNSGVGIMLGLAKSAIDEKRLIAPAGANAYEFYLSALQLDPSNAKAQEGLHDLFEPAADDVERAINNNELDEAQRELGLLRDFDGTNYKLALLGGKLDAQRQMQIRSDEARAAMIQSAVSSTTQPQ